MNIKFWKNNFLQRHRIYIYIGIFVSFLFILSGLYRYHQSIMTAENFCFYTHDLEKKSCLKDYQGKIVLLYFWSSDCFSCETKWSWLSQIWKERKEKGFEIIAIALKRSDPAQIQSLQDRGKLPPFPVIWDSTGEIAASYRGTRLTPTFFLLNRFGQLSWYKVGLEEESILIGKLDALLNY